MDVVFTNTSTYELPETGGMGITLFYVFGAIMMLAAGVLLVAKKRMASAE
jgi:LPXTG-motif cell wall-anchored protein